MNHPSYVPHPTLPTKKPKVVGYKYGLTNHFERDCQADPPVKPKIKDSTYYDRSVQELAKSEKGFIAIISRNV